MMIYYYSHKKWHGRKWINIGNRMEQQKIVVGELIFGMIEEESNMIQEY